MKQLIIIGASGHGKVVADCAAQNGYGSIIFLDDNEEITSCGKYKVVGKSRDARHLAGDVIVAIGNEDYRSQIQASIEESRLATLIHPKAVVSDDVEIGRGTVILAGAVINPGSRIGKGVIANTSSSIDHDCVVGDYCHIAVGAHLCGSVRLGDFVWAGAGAIVNNNIDICSRCTIGAGAVVVRDIERAGVYVGVPAKEIWKDGKRRIRL